MSAFTKALVVVVLVLSAGFAISQIILFNRREAYSEALKAHQPGEKVTVTVTRDGSEVTLEAVLGER